jgi:hypothetical protein
MNRFITLPYSGSKAHIALWEEAPDGTLKVVSIHSKLEDIPDFEEIETFQFDPQTTFDTGLPTNGGNHPVADADGKPLWIGCRISFNLPSHYINTVSGEGEFRKVDIFGGTYFLSDQPMNVYDQNGSIAEKRREQYTACNEYQYNGDYQGFRMTKGKLGDRFEHGQVSTFIRLNDDPRRVCELVPHVSARLGM